MAITTKAMMKNAISVEGLYGLYEEPYPNTELIACFKSALLLGMGCNCSTSEASVRTDYLYEGKSVAVSYIWCDLEDNSNYPIQRLDVSKEFAKAHRDQLIQLILLEWIDETVAGYSREWERTDSTKLTDWKRSEIVKECIESVEHLFNQLD